MRTGFSTGWGLFFLIIVWFCWGFSYPATKITLRGFDVWTSRLIIMATGGFLLLCLARLTDEQIRVPRNDWRDLILAAIFNMTVFQLGMTFGVHFFNAGRTVVIVYTMPLWAMLFAWILLKEIPTRKRLCGLGLGILGLFFLMAQDFTKLPSAYLGAACTLLGAVSFGLGTVWMKRRNWSNNATVLAGWQLVLGSIPVIPFWFFFGEKTNWNELTLDIWGSFIFLIVIANVLAYFSWFRVLSIFPTSISGLGTLAVPIVGLLASFMILGEVIGWREVIALILIVAALFLTLSQRQSD
jgi:drug/metabolite transporter (DMT)-like permease